MQHFFNPARNALQNIDPRCQQFRVDTPAHSARREYVRLPQFLFRRGQ